MRQRISAEPGYVLSRRAYRESSLLIEVFTEQRGRVGLVARAARRGRSPAAVLQAFTPLLLSWNESGELGTLTAVESAAAAVPLSGERIFHGWYVNELLLRLLQRHDAHPEVYRIYVELLPRLAAAGAEAALREFEWMLLGASGYGLELAEDLEPGQLYRLDPDGGLSLLPSTAQAGADTVSGAALIALRDQRLSEAGPDLRRQLKRLLREALRRQLGGRELETPRLLRELRATLATSRQSETF